MKKKTNLSGAQRARDHHARAVKENLVTPEIAVVWRATTKMEKDKLDKEDKTKKVDTKVFADVLLLTMLEIMGVEKFRVALSMALNRHASDSHLKTEKRQASEFYNVISDLKYLGWQTDDFKM